MTVAELFDEVVREAGLEQGRILHSLGVKTAGRFFAFVAKGDLVVKLPAERVDELVASGAGRPFDAGRGRPMREWVRLRPADAAACAAYTLEAGASSARLRRRSRQRSRTSHPRDRARRRQAS